MTASLRPALATLVFLVVAPGTVAGLVPFLITGGKRPTVAWGAGAGVVGVALAAGGAIVLLDAFRRFALEGRGTPAPVYPTRGLVASGPYRHVRNPMYLAVLALVLGQALVWASAALLVYAGFLALAFHLFVLAYEEPTLRRRFGDDYARYCRHVPRWRPRRRPWPQGVDSRPFDATIGQGWSRWQRR